MKNIIFFIVLSFLILPDFIDAQSSPIQAGTSPFNDELYHYNNIGLSTSNPNAYLHIVQKDGESQSSSLFKIEGTKYNFPDPGFSHVPYINVGANGNLGIGTNSPIQKLHVRGGSARIENNSYFLDIGATSFPDPFIRFRTNAQYLLFDNQITLTDRLVIESSAGSGAGNIQLALNEDGTIRAREVKVDLGVIPDYVFMPNYELMSIQELKLYINEYHHLPNIKSEEEFIEEGSYPLGEMNLKLLEKIEELTLYIIDLEERIQKLEADE